MLQLTIPGEESFDESTGQFVTINDTIIELEHSLLSLSKWEAIFEKPFLDQKQKTPEEILEYIKFMVTTPGVSPEVFNRLTSENVEAVMAYVQAPASATKAKPRTDPNKKPEILTSELMYYFMFSLGIPKECEQWHLNRLFALITIFSIKNSDQKPRKATAEDLARRRQLNEERKARYKTRG